MATLVEVSRQLSQQGSILQDTNRSIEEMLRVVQNQLRFFTKKEAGDRLQNLEDERERQRDSRPQSSVVEKLSAGNLDKVPTNFKDFLKFFGAGFGGVLAYLTERTFKALRKLLKGGLVLAIFPFVKDLADKIGEQFTKLIDIAFEDFLDFELTDEQKKKITSALGEGIKTGIIAKLFGFGTRTSLVAGLIGAAFDAVSNLFPAFGEYVEGTYDKVLTWLESTGPAGSAAANFMKNNSELMKTVFSIAGAVIATRLLPAVFALGGTIVASVFGYMAMLFAGAKTVVMAGGGLGLVIGGTTIALIAAGALAYYFEDEIKSALKKSMDALMGSVEDISRKIYRFAKDSIISSIDALRYFFLGIDPSQFKQETLNEKEKIKAELEELQYNQQKEVVGEIKKSGGLYKEGGAMTPDLKNAIDAIREKYAEAIKAKEAELEAINLELDEQGADKRPLYKIPGGNIVYEDVFKLNLDYFRKNPNAVLPGTTAEEIKQFLQENRQYELQPPNVSTVSGNDLSSNQQNINISNSEAQAQADAFNLRHMITHGYMGTKTAADFMN